MRARDISFFNWTEEQDAILKREYEFSVRNKTSMRAVQHLFPMRSMGSIFSRLRSRDYYVSPQQPPPWSQKQKDRARELYESGVSMEKISIEMNLSRKSVSRNLYRMRCVREKKTVYKPIAPPALPAPSREPAQPRPARPFDGDRHDAYTELQAATINHLADLRAAGHTPFTPVKDPESRVPVKFSGIAVNQSFCGSPSQMCVG